MSSLHLSVRPPRALGCSYQAMGLTGRRPGAGEPALAGIARCQAHLSRRAGVTVALDHVELAVPWAHTESHPASPPQTSLRFPASSGVVHLWPVGSFLPAVLGSCQVKSWLAPFDPTCELFYFPLSPLHGFGVLL